MSIIIFIQLNSLMMSLIQENLRYLYLDEKHNLKKKARLQEVFQSNCLEFFLLNYLGVVAKARNVKNKMNTWINNFKSKRRREL